MGLLQKVSGTAFILRRILAELRGIRRALERQADVLELAHLDAEDAKGGGKNAFRGFSRERTAGQADQSGVTYANPEELANLLAIEEDLKGLLGRDPTDAEMERAIAGVVE